MKIENIERVSEILKYLQDNDAEREVWDIAYTIESITVSTHDGPHVFTGQFDLNSVKEYRLKFLDMCRSQWHEELETL